MNYKFIYKLFFFSYNRYYFRFNTNKNKKSYQAFIFYIMQYILTNLNAFLVIIGIGFSLYLYHTNISENNNLSEKNNSPIQLVSQLKGYFSINPVLALCLAISMFSFV